VKLTICLMILLTFSIALDVDTASGQTSLSLEIHREGSLLELEEVVKILEAGFQAIHPSKKYWIEIKSVHQYEKIRLPSGILQCDLLIPETARSGGKVSALLLFRTHGREVGKSRVNATVDIYTDVIVSARYMGRHQDIQTKDLQWMRRSLATLPNDFLSEMKEVLGKRTIIAVNRGEVLRAGMVEEPPLLKKGDRVILVLENPQLKITTFGEVKEEGRRGDRIKLVNLSSRKEVSGRILDGHTVRIDF